MTTFESLGIAPSILKALTAKGYTQPTPIQEQAIPAILQGSDVFGTASTGTGKTAAFALPILQKLSTLEARTPGVKALILAPTRELAQQIRDNFSAYGSHLPLKYALIYGGVAQTPQRDALRRNPEVVIATPGRLLDLMEQGIAKINSVDMLVLDEADRMLDMGFIHDIKRIMSKLPVKRQTILFSATTANGIKDLIKNFMTNPVQIHVAPVKSTAVIKHSIYHVGKSNKFDLLRHLLADEADHHAIVFTRTKRGADSLVKNLTREGIQSLAIHGNKSQNERVRNLQSFKTKKVKILVATDVAARGIDVKELSHVINFDMPEDTDTYIHRAGRTGRAGASGKAYTFMMPDERQELRQLNKVVKDLQIVQEHPFAQGGTDARVQQRREQAPRERQQPQRAHEQNQRERVQAPQRVQRPHNENKRADNFNWEAAFKNDTDTNSNREENFNRADNFNREKNFNRANNNQRRQHNNGSGNNNRNRNRNRAENRSVYEASPVNLYDTRSASSVNNRPNNSFGENRSRGENNGGFRRKRRYASGNN